MPTYWTCPYCNRDATLRDHDTSESEHRLTIESADGYRWLESQFIVCPNPSCRKFTLSLVLSEALPNKMGGYVRGKDLQSWNLIPPSKAKPFPNYIPVPVLADYNEACLIRELSPKASATLARRCLQGMIRDFWGVKAGNLADEIKAVKDKVEPDDWDAIDAVRKVGNIGAHMEKDVNVIIDVEPKEAGLLIDLIELLLNEWYVNRENRKRR